MTTISIVIATDGRRNALEQTLQALQYLEGPEFEVIVVMGPTRDGTDEVVAAWGDAIKACSNPHRNLSQSRNLGIRQASGDIVAFIDDDGIPEPEWLSQIVAAFNDPKVAGAGGVVMDHTGWTPQYLYSSANRLGLADWQRKTPADHFNFPYSYEFPYLQGTNSAFRRSMLLEAGAFDEEYEFYLDETDVCCRMVDRGWLIRQLPDAVVHHKFLPSKIRDAKRITRSRYAILKNKLYFSLINNHGHYLIDEALRSMDTFVEGSRQDMRFHCEAGNLPWSQMEIFEDEARRAWEDGLRRGMSGRRRTLDPKALSTPPAFRPFPKLHPKGSRKHYVFASSEFPPERTGGIGRYIHQLSRELAALGHHVRVIAETTGHPRIDFEDGVWVERLPSFSTEPLPQDLHDMPAEFRARAATVRERIAEIDRSRPVSAVYTPIWNSEGIAVFREGRHPLVVGLQTTLKFWLDSHPHLKDDDGFMAHHGTPMLRTEHELLRQAPGLHSISEPLLENLIGAYGISGEDGRARVIPLGLDDWTVLPTVAPAPLPGDGLRILFVGRLELRKGIDVLLDIVPGLLEAHPDVSFDIVGNTTIPAADGKTFREAFLARELSPGILERVRFHGEIQDAALRGHYAACDIMVGPSRYESFGLMLVEAMMFGKPVVGCAAGGMLEVVEDGVSGLLARPGDRESLRAALESLIRDPDLRVRLGRAGRARYEERFTARRMARDVADFLGEVEASWHAPQRERENEWP